MRGEPPFRAASEGIVGTSDRAEKIVSDIWEMIFGRRRFASPEGTRRPIESTNEVITDFV